MLGQSFIKNRWVEGAGEEFTSLNPAIGEIIWRGTSASKEQVSNAVQAANNALHDWAQLTFDKRLAYLQKFTAELQKERAQLSKIISKETGKPLWESDSEVGAMINKLSISVEAYHDRCKELINDQAGATSITRHRPHGVLAVLGPFNLPGHLPNGHIIPALLAGNTVVFKASELTPLVAESIFGYWEKAGLPPGVINLLQGGKSVGEWLASHDKINGLLFTGSFKTGQAIGKRFSEVPGKILSLEMGGNNPLVVHHIKNIQAAVYHVIQSAFVTSGQRCTCARRLIVTKSEDNRNFIEALIKAMKNIKIGAYTDLPEPFMGPVISKESANKILSASDALIALGALPLISLHKINDSSTFLSPGLLDVTPLNKRMDEEIFGPLLQLYWVEDFRGAIYEANETSYGLAAGLLSDDEQFYHQFLTEVKAGVINWNHPLTGASSKAPFGGIGSSGNHRPSAYYAADYCAYPVASLENKELKLPNIISPGLTL